LLQARPALADVITGINPHNTARQYRINPGALDLSALVYTDRPYTWLNIPPSLLRADYVQTANDDKINTAFSIDITLGQNANLYVFYDDRLLPGPSWLTSTFVNTGDHIFTNEAGTSRPFTIFQREVGPGTVTLLSNGTTNSNSSMYMIAAVAVVPEPGSLALLGLGTFAILTYSGLRRRDGSRNT
jgi:hypothetical protein